MSEKTPTTESPSNFKSEKEEEGDEVNFEELEAIREGRAMPTLEALNDSFEVRDAFLSFLSDTYESLSDDERKEFENGLKLYKSHTENWATDSEAQIAREKRIGRIEGAVTAGIGAGMFVLSHATGSSGKYVALTLVAFGLFRMFFKSDDKSFVSYMRQKGEFGEVMQRAFAS